MSQIAAYDSFRIPNNDIRPSSSPQDLTMLVRNFISAPTVTVPYIAGTKVYVVPMWEAIVTTVNDESVVDLSSIDTTSDPAAKCLVFANAIHEMF